LSAAAAELMHVGGKVSHVAPPTKFELASVLRLVQAIDLLQVVSCLQV